MVLTGPMRNIFRHSTNAIHGSRMVGYSFAQFLVFVFPCRSFCFLKGLFGKHSVDWRSETIKHLHVVCMVAHEKTHRVWNRPKTATRLHQT